MPNLAEHIAAYVQAEVARQVQAGYASLSVGTVVTSPSQVSNLPLTVIFDGSSLAVAVKQVRGLPMTAGTRCILGKFGSDWVVLGGLTNPATGTGTSRIVIGADVPAELKAYGIDTAILSYLNDKATGQECGYFFIGASNRFDGTGTNRVQAFGNVVYPTLGNPASATMSNVKTNFQQDMFSPFPQTIFKDQDVYLWTNLIVDMQNGASKFDVAGTSKLIARIDDNDIQAGQPGTPSTVETWHTLSLSNGWTGTLKYRYIASPAKCVELFAGSITPGTKADGTTIGTLPVGYRPATSQDVAAVCNPTVSGGQSPHFNVLTTGAINCWGWTSATGGAVPAGTLVSLDG